MPDQREWIKLWDSLLSDSKFQNIRLEDIGRWCLLLLCVARDGERGKLTIIPPAKVLVATLRCDTLDQLLESLKRLPNVHFAPPSNDNANITVIIRKWFTYQVDFNAYSRLKKFRLTKVNKREMITVQDKIREDKTLTSKSKSTSLAATPSPFGGAVAAQETAAEKSTAAKEDTCRMTPEEMREIRLGNLPGGKNRRPGGVT